MVSVILIILGLVLLPILEKFICVLEKNMYSAVVGCAVLYMSVWTSWLKLFKSTVSLRISLLLRWESQNNLVPLWTCLLFLLSWCFYHYELSLFISGKIPWPEVYFDITVPIPAFLWLVCAFYIFSIFHFVFVFSLLTCLIIENVYHLDRMLDFLVLKSCFIIFAFYLQLHLM